MAGPVTTGVCAVTTLLNIKLDAAMLKVINNFFM
jgi:hypothetical protein